MCLPDAGAAKPGGARVGVGVRSAWGKQLPLCGHLGPEESGQILGKSCQEQSGGLMPLLPKEERAKTGNQREPGRPV